MKRVKLFLKAVLLLLLLTVFTSCGSREEISADPAGDFKEAYEKYRMMDDHAAKADMMDEFVTSYPDSDLAGRAVGLVVYNRHLVNDDFAGALEYLDSKLAVIEKPAVNRSMKLQKIEVLGELKKADELTSLAGELLDSPQGMSGGEKQQVLTAATNAGAWNLADRVSDLLLADLRETEDKYALSSVLAKKAQVINNLDRNGEALELFEEAASVAPRNLAGYFEYPVMDLEHQWAVALLESGNPEKALEVFEKRALFVKEETPEIHGMHQKFFRDLYLESGKDESEFEAYKAERKNAYSQQVPDFRAPDSTGRMLSFSEIMGEKATLLVFWFPT